MKEKAKEYNFKFNTCEEVKEYCFDSRVRLVCRATCGECFHRKSNTEYIFSPEYFDLINHVLKSLQTNVENRLLKLIEERGHYFNKKLKYRYQSINSVDGELVTLTWAKKTLANKDKTNTTWRERQYIKDVQQLIFDKSASRPGTLINLQVPFDPVGVSSMDWVQIAREEMDKIQNTWHADVKFGNEGTTKLKAKIFTRAGIVQNFLDGKSITEEAAKTTLIYYTMFVIVFFSFVAFRSIFLAIRLMLTIILTLGSVFGTAQIILMDLHVQNNPELGFFYLIPILSIPVMVGLTLDYDMFLVSRIHEFRKKGFSTTDSILLGLANTGSTITSAGIIMFFTFFSLLQSSAPVVVQLGAILVTVCFIDTCTFSS